MKIFLVISVMLTILSPRDTISQVNEEWVKRYSSTGDHDDRGEDLATDAAGNVYVTGTVIGLFGDGNFYTIKYDPAGNVLWSKTYDGANFRHDAGKFVALDGSGNVYAGGNNGIGDRTNDMTLDASGNIYLAGQVKGQAGSNGPDMVTLKYNPAGTLQWAQKFNGTANYTDVGKCIGVDASGNVYVGGSAAATGTNLDVCLLKYNSAGVQQWVKYINGAGNGSDAANDLILDPAGNILITGNSVGLGTGNNYITMRYNPSGILIWSQTYLGPGNASDIAYSIGLGTNGVVYVTGASDEGSTGMDFATVKYAQTVGVQNVSSEIPAEFSLGQNYPNPFNPTTNIGLRVADFGFVSLKVYDIAGKEAAVLVNENLSAGTYNIDFDASQLSSGTYFYRLVVGDPSTGSGQVFTEVKKMVLVK